MRKIAISDIHGCNATFEALLQQLELSKEDHLFLLGDYIDRGPSSKQVLDTIFRLMDEGYQVQCLRGNHEEMLLWAYENAGYDLQTFLNNGGEITLASFGAQHPRGIDSRYIDFINNLPYYLESDEYIFVHAGLNFSPRSHPLEDKDRMLWIRHWYPMIDYQWLGKRYIVHGHTPTLSMTINKNFQFFEELKVLNIDAGCVFPMSGYGNLCAVDLTGRELYFMSRSKEDEIGDPYIR